MDAQWLLGWWNLIFLVPFGLALAYLFAYTLSGWTFGDVDLDADADLDADVEVDADLEVDGGQGGIDLPGNFESDAHPHHGHHAHDAHQPHDGLARKLLIPFTWVGVGRMPLSLVLMVFALVFGITGLVTNQGLREAMGWMAVWVSLPVASVVSFGVTSLVSQAMVRYMPLSETSARPRSALVGRRGTAVFTIDADSGVVVVKDEDDRYQMAARTAPGDPRIPAGTEVVLVRYDTERGLFLVKPSGLG